MDITPPDPTPDVTADAKHSRNRRLVVGSVTLALLAATGYFVSAQKSAAQLARKPSKLTLSQIPFDGQAALGWVERVCALGPRFSGSPGMQKQQALLIPHFQKLGGQVEMQRFAVRHPLNGQKVDMANLVVRWHPERKERILLCAHYDTRPFPDQDRANPKGVFVGANDGGSGVGVLAEMARHMSKFDSKLGVDFALFDGEELIYVQNGQQAGQYFLGSLYFANQYANDKNRSFRYRAAVLLDMVGDQFLDLYQERNGAIKWKDSRWIVKSIWKKARELGVTEFVNKPWNKDILDDHIMLHEYGKIPACDIIDFYYRSRDRRTDYWHTTQDTPDKCSALSLAKVGWVVHEWLKDEGRKTK